MVYLSRVKRLWYFSPMRAAKVQASLRIRTVSPEPPLLAHTSSESRGTFRQKAISIAPLNGWDAQLKFVMTECSKTQIRLTHHICNVHIQYLAHVSRRSQVELIVHVKQRSVSLDHMSEL